MSKNSKKPTCLILGAGVIGLSLAWELAQRGFSVIIADRGRPGRGASWAGAGILPPAATIETEDPYEQLRSRSHRLHAQWASRLLELTGLDNEFQASGGIYLALSAAERATLVGNQFWWEEHKIAYESLDSTQLRTLEPGLAPLCSTNSDVAAWYLPDECQLRNPAHLNALLAACQATGVKILPSAEITDLLTDRSRVLRARCKDGSEITADQFCVCSGAWARLLLDRWDISNGLMPVRGQMVLYNCGQPLLQRIVNEGNRYLVPRRDGLLLAGSIEEEVGYVCETTEAAITQIRDWAESILPTLAQVPVEKTWAGLRPGSFDGLPYLGAIPGFSNAYLAAGHFRSGLHLSCATAEVMADVIEGKPPAIDLSQFRVGRG